MKKIHKTMLASALALLVLGVGAVSAVSKSLTKNDEIEFKQAMKPKDAEEFTQSIGIFAPGFDNELADAKAGYALKYGDGNFQILDYSGYALLVPPSISSDAFADAEAQVKSMILDRQNGILDEKTQNAQITRIRDVFGVEGTISYDASLGAYTDEQGFQYNFRDGELDSKQVGLTSALQAKFTTAYPYFQPGVARTAAFSSAQAKSKADQAINKMFGSDLATRLRTNVQSINLGEDRIGFIYGSQEVNVLVDQVSGDIINFNRGY